MKKIVSFIIVLGILFLVFQFGINLFKTKHTVNYNLMANDNKISIHEEYYKDKKDDYYFFELSLDKKKFVFDVKNTFNKQRKVISDIKLYQKDDLTCISPIYIKNNDDPIIVCNIGNEQYSYTSIKDKYNLEEFISTIPNFNKEKYESNNKPNSISGMTVYKENMYDNENIIIYNYNDLVKINKPSYDIIQFASYDIYHNELGILIDKYYILPKYENKPEYAGLLIIDITNGKIDNLFFDDKLSTNLYINGVVDNKLYLFDKSNLIQYEVDPKKKAYRITGNRDTNGQYYDGEWSTKNIYDFSKQELEFHYNYPIKDNYVSAYETNKYYYYYNNKNEFYKVYKKDLNKRIFLFRYSDMKSVNVVDDYIYFIDHNTLYRYDDTGLKTMLTNKEFQYNYNNIYSVYFK